MASDETPTRARPERKGLLTNASWNGAYVALTMVLSFVATPILIGRFGLEDYGLLVVLWGVAGILGSVDLGLGESTVRFVARYLSNDDIEGANRVFTASLTLFGLICVTLLTGVLLAAPLVTSWLGDPERLGPEGLETVAGLLRIAAFTIAISILTRIYAAVPAAVHRFDVSNKVMMSSSLLRSSGHVAIALSGFSFATIIVWDLCLSIATFAVATMAARSMLPELRLFPRPSFVGIREVLGYSVFSFLTFFLHKWHLEFGKLIISRMCGSVFVARISSPDNIAQRFREVLTGGLESTFPKFSESKDREASTALLWRATWAIVALSTIVFVPFITIVPEFIRLWIPFDPDDAEFAVRAGEIGPLLGIHLMLQSAFGAHAVYFRGTGRPWIVTLVTAAALGTTAAVAITLVPQNGPIGAAQGLLAGSSVPFFALFVTSFTEFGSSAVRHLSRSVLVPLLCGGAAFLACSQAKHLIGTDSWVRIAPTGALLTAICVLIVFGVDQLLHGSNGVSNQILRKVGRKLPQRFVPRYLRDEEQA